MLAVIFMLSVILRPDAHFAIQLPLCLWSILVGAAGHVQFHLLELVRNLSIASGQFVVEGGSQFRPVYSFMGFCDFKP